MRDKTLTIEAIFKRYKVKDLDDLNERLKVYEYLASHRYHAIEQDTYKTMIRDCKELQKIKEKQMELKDTTEMMNSPDYKERFKAEYYQLKIRGDKLLKLITDYEGGTLGFQPKCSISILKLQFLHMKQYKEDLEKRAEIEEIKL